MHNIYDAYNIEPTEWPHQNQKLVFKEGWMFVCPDVEAPTSTKRALFKRFRFTAQ